MAPSTKETVHYQVGKRPRTKSVTSSDDECGGGNGLGTVAGPPIKKFHPDDELAALAMNRSRFYNFGYRKKPAELFRKDLISAMKLPDSDQLDSSEYLVITDSWREEWEKGVQVPVNPDATPRSESRRIISSPTTPSKSKPSSTSPHKGTSPKKSDTSSPYKMPKKLIISEPENPENVRYELDLVDVCWLRALADSGLVPINTTRVSEDLLEDVINYLEHDCAHNIKNKKLIHNPQSGSGSRKRHSSSSSTASGDRKKSSSGNVVDDDDIICDVCRSPDGEDGNEMVFCERCDICVHQACYGIPVVPDDDWYCRVCEQHMSTQVGQPAKKISCCLCPNEGGALKPTSNKKWAHIACALWISEVKIGDVTTMEPITRVNEISQARLNLLCVLCKKKRGAPIQCSVKTCKTAYHVTCAFKHGLKMKAIMDEATKGCKLRSFCVKHSDRAVECTGDNPVHEIDLASSSPQTTSGAVSENDLDFWRYASTKKVLQTLNTKDKYKKLSNKLDVIVDLMFNYWKLKRSSHNGASLIKLTTSVLEEQHLQERKELMRLRVELERVRNLSYMIIRRERTKREWIRTQREILNTSMRICDPHGTYLPFNGPSSSSSASHATSDQLPSSTSSSQHQTISPSQYQDVHVQYALPVPPLLTPDDQKNFINNLVYLNPLYDKIDGITQLLALQHQQQQPPSHPLRSRSPLSASTTEQPQTSSTSPQSSASLMSDDENESIPVIIPVLNEEQISAALRHAAGDDTKYRLRQISRVINRLNHAEQRGRVAANPYAKHYYMAIKTRHKSGSGSPSVSHNGFHCVSDADDEDTNDGHLTPLPSSHPGDRKPRLQMTLNGHLDESSRSSVRSLRRSAASPARRHSPINSSHHKVNSISGERAKLRSPSPNKPMNGGVTSSNNNRPRSPVALRGHSNHPASSTPPITRHRAPLKQETSNNIEDSIGQSLRRRHTPLAAVPNGHISDAEITPPTSPVTRRNPKKRFPELAGSSTRHMNGTVHSGVVMNGSPPTTPPVANKRPKSELANGRAEYEDVAVKKEKVGVNKLVHKTKDGTTFKSLNNLNNRTQRTSPHLYHARRRLKMRHVKYVSALRSAAFASSELSGKRKNAHKNNVNWSNFTLLFSTNG